MNKESKQPRQKILDKFLSPIHDLLDEKRTNPSTKHLDIDILICLMLEEYENSLEQRSLYKFEVLPENQCAGMHMWAKEQGHNRFEGFVRYDKRKKLFYLTTDDITYVEVSKVLNVKPVDSENW